MMTAVFLAAGRDADAIKFFLSQHFRDVGVVIQPKLIGQIAPFSSVKIANRDGLRVRVFGVAARVRVPDMSGSDDGDF